MTKRDWIYGGIIAILFVSIGLAIGIHFRKSKEWKIELRGQIQQMEELDKKLEETEDAFDESQKAADKASKEKSILAEQNVVLAAKLAASRRAVKARPSPKTFAECKLAVVEYEVYTGNLEGSVDLLTKELRMANIEIFSLRDVIEGKDIYIFTVEEQLKVQQNMNKIYKRMSKKDKRVKIWSNILSGGLGLVVGVGVGKVSN